MRHALLAFLFVLPFPGEAARAQGGARAGLAWLSVFEAGPEAPVWAQAVAVGGEGLVCAAGELVRTFHTSNVDDSDYVTVCYDRDGHFRWARTYDGPAHRRDVPWAMAVGPDGSVYVTGMSMYPFDEGRELYGQATVKYTAEGDEAWVARLDSGTVYPSDLAVDERGALYVSAWLGSEDAYSLVKYGPDGAELWRRSHPQVQTDCGRDHAPKTSWAHPPWAFLDLDGAGNVYVSGQNFEPCSDLETLKYDTDGTLQWKARYAGDGETDDIVDALAVGDDGQVYVVASSGTLATAGHYVTLAYDAAGVERWRQVFGEGAGSADARAAAAAPGGGVYVAGSVKEDGAEAFLTVHYGPDGDVRWARRAFPAEGWSRASAVVTGPGVYVFGQAADSLAGIGYTLEGGERWTVALEDFILPWTASPGVATDGEGGFYAVATRGEPEEPGVLAVVKFQEEGIVLAGEPVPGVSPGALASEVYPIPATGPVHVRFGLPAPGHVRLDVYDLLGRRVLGLPARAFPAGPGNVVAADLTGLRSGVYVYVLTAETDGPVAQGRGKLLLLR